MKFIKVTDRELNNSPVYISVEKITFIEKGEDGGTIIELVSGAVVNTDISIEEIVNLLGKAGCYASSN